MTPLPQVNSAYVVIALSLNFAPPEKVLEGTELAATEIGQAVTIDLDTVRRVIANLNQYSHTPLWATLLGGHLGVATHGPVSNAILSAPTLGKALATFAEWEHLRVQAYRCEIVDNDTEVELIIHDTTGDKAFKPSFFEILARGMEMLITQITGSPAKGLTRIYFENKVPDHRTLMGQAYFSELCFNASSNKLVIAKTLWSYRSPLYDKESYELSLSKCRQLRDVAAARGSVDMTVRQSLRDHFEQSILGSQAPSPPPDLRALCKLVHTSERTLIRQLKCKSTSYKRIVEEERRHYAERLLNDVRYNILDISELLGYREPASFCRAFKRWFGVSPSSYRRV